MVQANNYNTEVQDMISAALKSLTKVGIHTYMSDSNTTYSKLFINAFKKVTEVLKDYKEIPYGYKVYAIWFDDSASTPYFNIDAHNSNYKQVKLTTNKYHNDKITEKAAKAIASILSQMVNDITEMQEKAKNKPSIEEIQDTFLSYFNKHISKDFKTAKEYGKLNKENSTEPYNCIVVRKNKTDDYVSSYTFHKDAIGNYTMISKVPLCGEFNISFSLDKAEDNIKAALKFIHAA